MSNKVLLVEDTEDDTLIYREFLERLGFSVETEYTLAGALGRLKRMADVAWTDPYQFYVVDIKLGDDLEGGCKLVKELRNVYQRMEPVSLLSALYRSEWQTFCNTQVNVVWAGKGDGFAALKQALIELGAIRGHQ